MRASVAIVLILILAALAYLLYMGLRTDRPGEAGAPPTHGAGKASTVVYAYLPVEVDGEVVMQPQSIQVSSWATPLYAAVSGLIGKDKGVFRSDVTLLSAHVEHGTAVLNFGPGIEAGYGTDEEEIVLKALCMTAGQFPEVHHVRIVVNGHPIETLASVNLTEPLPVIRPD
jgi:spore germination protein GerM